MAIDTGAQVAQHELLNIYFHYTTSPMANQTYLVTTVINYVHVWPPDTSIEIVMTLAAFNAFLIVCMQFTIDTLIPYVAW